MRILICILFMSYLWSCNESKKTNSDIDKTQHYTQEDTLNLNGHKFSKKEFNAIVDNFPRLYQDEVLHPDSLYKLEFSNPNFAISYEQNGSFDSDAGQDRFFTLYAYFLAIKNKDSRFEYLRNHLNKSYATINTIFERLSRGSTHYIHQSSCIPAYVEYDIYFINNSLRLPEFTKKTRAERFEFIEELNAKIANESQMADISYESENEKMADLIEKLNEEIVNDYVLFKSKEFIKPYLKKIKEIQKENGNL